MVDYIERRMQRMPRELVGLIYGYIDMETRLSLLLHNYTNNILQYIVSIPIELLIKMWKRNVRDKIYSDSDCNTLTSTFDKILPETKYLYNNTEYCIKHPIYEVIKYDVKLNSYRIKYGTEFQKCWYMRSQIETLLLYIPTIYTLNENFDYRIRKVLFRFVQLLMKPIRCVKKRQAAAEIARLERVHRYKFKRRILPKLLVAVRKYERKRVAQIKFAEKEQKAEQKRMKQAEQKRMKREETAEKAEQKLMKKEETAEKKRMKMEEKAEKEEQKLMKKENPTKRRLHIIY
jgi:hypothetical protein